MTRCGENGANVVKQIAPSSNALRSSPRLLRPTHCGTGPLAASLASGLATAVALDI